MNRSSRREEAPINFGFRISDFEKRASYSEKGIGGNARPHPAFAGRSQSGHLQQNCYGGRRPGPLPQERGEARTVPGIFAPFGVELLHGDSRRLLRGSWRARAGLGCSAPQSRLVTANLTPISFSTLPIAE